MEIQITKWIHGGPVRDPACLFDLRQSMLIAAGISAVLILCNWDNHRVLEFIGAIFLALGSVSVGATLIDLLSTTNSISNLSRETQSHDRVSLRGGRAELSRVLHYAKCATLKAEAVTHSVVRADVQRALYYSLFILTVIWGPLLKGSSTTWALVVLGGLLVAVVHAIGNRTRYLITPSQLQIVRCPVLGPWENWAIDLKSARLHCDFSQRVVILEHGSTRFTINLGDLSRPHHFVAVLIAALGNSGQSDC